MLNIVKELSQRELPMIKPIEKDCIEFMAMKLPDWAGARLPASLVKIMNGFCRRFCIIKPITMGNSPKIILAIPYKTIPLFLLQIFLSAFIYCQDTLFTNTIPAQELNKELVLNQDILTVYGNTRYVKQKDFMKPADLLMKITEGIILDCQYQSKYNYPTGSFSYKWQIKQPYQGYVSFSKFNDRISGIVELDNGTKYLINQTGQEYFAISTPLEIPFIERETEPDFTLPSLKDQTDNPVTLSTPGICDEDSSCIFNSVIDLMVLYTPEAEKKWGGSNNAIANITLAVSNLNISLNNSGINNVTFRLVKTFQVDYIESGDIYTDLNRLKNMDDGYMDTIHQLRTNSGADLVSLITATTQGFCGLGTLNLSLSPGSAFNVVLYSCVIANYSLAHELGHNLSLRHDWYIDSSSTPCPNQHGYVNQTAIQLGKSSSSSQRWRTIMAYNNQCSDSGFNCTRLNRWSNPKLVYNGDLMGAYIGGNYPSDEYFAFNRIACRAASFLPTAPLCDPLPGNRAINIWNGSVSAAWSEILNWSCNKVPDSNTDVIIPSGSNVNVASDITIGSLKLEANASLNILPPFKINIIGN